MKFAITLGLISALGISAGHANQSSNATTFIEKGDKKGADISLNGPNAPFDPTSPALVPSKGRAAIVNE